MIIPGLGGLHISSFDVKSKTCITVLLSSTIKHGVKKGISEYRQCITRGMENFYNPEALLISSSMLGKSKSEKPISPIKQAKLDYKATKKAAKTAKKSAKAKPASSSGKMVSKAGVIVSKFMTAGSAIAGAAAYHSYTISGISSHMTMALGGATGAISLLQAAPLAKSISRLNKASGSSSSSESVSAVSDIQSALNDIKNKLDAPPVPSAPAVSAEQFNALQQEVVNLKSSLASPASSPAEPVAASQPAPQQVSKPSGNTHIAK